VFCVRVGPVVVSPTEVCSPLTVKLSDWRIAFNVNVLVTGGAGYIGSIAAEELLRAGHRVAIYDNLSHGKRSAAPAGADLIVGDIADRDALRDTFIVAHKTRLCTSLR
jgi:NADPH-dependent 2,4-dienoyl-CoA reductase/sulfur reductase-like enzyme